jgi:hypothetical protein
MSPIRAAGVNGATIHRLKTGRGARPSAGVTFCTGVISSLVHSLPRNSRHRGRESHARCKNTKA